MACANPLKAQMKVDGNLIGDLARQVMLMDVKSKTKALCCGLYRFRERADEVVGKSCTKKQGDYVNSLYNLANGELLDLICNNQRSDSNVCILIYKELETAPLWQEEEISSSFIVTVLKMVETF